jgi:hypothetical protein
MRSSWAHLEIINRFCRYVNRFTWTVSSRQEEQLPRATPGKLGRKARVGSGLMLMAIVLLAVGVTVVKSMIDNSQAGLSFSGSTRADALAGLGQAQTVPSTGPIEAVPVVPAEEEVPLTLETRTYEDMFQEIAPQYDLDWRILESLAYRESRMNYLALGRSSDMGLMQVIPPTWNEWAPKVDVFDPFDPYSNILVGAAYLAYVRDFSGEQGYPEPKWMLVAYNWGPNRLKRFWEDGGTWGEVPATQRKYALRILEMAADRSVNRAVFDQIYVKVVVDQ